MLMSMRYGRPSVFDWKNKWIKGKRALKGILNIQKIIEKQRLDFAKLTPELQ